MSMYTQVPVYPQGVHPPQQVPGYPYQQPPFAHPPSANVYHVDPNSFRFDFAARLEDLKINSRPIIQSLSMYAQEYSQWADVVAQCLQSHIRKVPPWVKLPAFYLLDAISKNVFDPYARHFAPFVIRLFLETYQQVDQPTRSKMEEMLITWRTGAPGDKELFGTITQRSIEQGIWGGDLTSQVDPGGHNQVSRAQVLSELEFTLGQKERSVQANPWDQAIQRHIQVLQQLRTLVEAGVSQDELRQILSQLRTLARTNSSSQTPPCIPTYPPHHRLPHPGTSVAQPVSAAYSHHTEPAKSQYTDMSSLVPAMSTNVSPLPSIPPTNIASLYNALLKAGVVSPSSTLVGTGSANEPYKQGSEITTDQTRDAMRAYRKAVLLDKIKLTTTDILKKRTSCVDFLYMRLPIQCKQCGLRFNDDPHGKRQRDHHLDMHFKQNSGVTQNGRGYSRNWFVSREEWTAEDALDAKGKKRVDGTKSTSNQTVDSIQRDAELRAQFIIVPSGDEAKSISCPICKESMKAEFLEEDEEWVWRNAVKRDDRMYHATCHSEALTSAHSVAARLRNDAFGRSRSRTPEVSGLRLTPPKPIGSGPHASLSPSPDTKRAMLKRKAMDEGPSLDGYAAPDYETPPMKKYALHL